MEVENNLHDLIMDTFYNQTSDHYYVKMKIIIIKKRIGLSLDKFYSKMLECSLCLLSSVIK